jgi:hypothetical protein
MTEASSVPPRSAFAVLMSTAKQAKEGKLTSVPVPKVQGAKAKKTRRLGTPAQEQRRHEQSARRRKRKGLSPPRPLVENGQKQLTDKGEARAPPRTQSPDNPSSKPVICNPVNLSEVSPLVPSSPQTFQPYVPREQRSPPRWQGQDRWPKRPRFSLFVSQGGYGSYQYDDESFSLFH